MSGMKMKDEVEIDEFAEELSDEALDRDGKNELYSRTGQNCCTYFPRD